MRKSKYLIIGQGIAGSVLALSFFYRNIDFTIIDEYNPNSASNAAAGIANPVNFRRFIQAWKSDEITPFSLSFYKQIELELKEKLFESTQIFKLLANDTETNFWFEKYNSNEHLKLFSDGKVRSGFSEILHNESKYITINGYRLYIQKFLNKVREFLIYKEFLLENRLDDIDLSKVIKNSEYLGTRYDKVILCSGYKIGLLDLSQSMRFLPSKGEIIDFKSDMPKFNGIINKNIFLLHLGDGIFRCGATYRWDDFSEVQTSVGKQELSDKLSKLIKNDFEIVNHYSGIRPTVQDRRPIIGVHTKMPNLVYFTGFGTKGVNLSPYLADMLINHLEENSHLDFEVDIARFK